MLNKKRNKDVGLYDILKVKREMIVLDVFIGYVSILFNVKHACKMFVLYMILFTIHDAAKSLIFISNVQPCKLESNLTISENFLTSSTLHMYDIFQQI